MATDYIIDSVASEDIDQMLVIENENPSPWSRKQLLEELSSSGSWGYAARQGEGKVVIGFILGRTVIDEAEIFRLAVLDQYRRLGIARKLLNSVLMMLLNKKVTKCFLELRSSNEAAFTLYRESGFKKTAVRKDYYSDPKEDAVVMTINL